MTSLKIVFIHGNCSMRWSFAWTPWLKSELENLGFRVVFETFPDSILARKKYWLPFLKDYLNADQNTLLIGWSSGAVAALKYAEENKIYGSILIAPSYTDLGQKEEKDSEWFDEPFVWEKIKRNQKNICLLFSKNDEYIPLSEFQYIKDKLTPDIVIEFERNGHFINQSTFPEVINCVIKITSN